MMMMMMMMMMMSNNDIVNVIAEYRNIFFTSAITRINIFYFLHYPKPNIVHIKRIDKKWF